MDVIKIFFGSFSHILRHKKERKKLSKLVVRNIFSKLRNYYVAVHIVLFHLKQSLPGYFTDLFVLDSLFQV